MASATPLIPRRNWPLARGLGKLTLRLFGWRIEGGLPDVPKGVIAVAPHTSNWDWVFGMATALALDLDANWLGKHSLFEGPWRGILLRLGGIPVNRSHPQGIIEQAVAECRQRPHFLIGISPEGTRRPVTSWKSGCCRLAHAAQIPLIPATLDYPNKRIRFFPHWIPGKDSETELQRLSDCFSASLAKFPEKFKPHQPSTITP